MTAAKADPPAGYTEEDTAQQGWNRPVSRRETDARGPFQHDVDRLLYSAEFRALAWRTQVVAADQMGIPHNRLTHSLKVAQIGKRLTALLGQSLPKDFEGLAPPSPALVEAAGLLHDLGHPPFGHIGETEITRALDRLTDRSTATVKPDDSSTLGDTSAVLHPDGYQANAQNLRIVTKLAVRSEQEPWGLHLTRATLDASVKYPWGRGRPKTFGGKHWGCYASEVEELQWIGNGRYASGLPVAPTSADDATVRPVEEQIMDWADEVTYACHDVEDFYRAGLIPLPDILDGLPAYDPRRTTADMGYETTGFLDHLEQRAREGDRPFDRQNVIENLRRIQNIVTTMYPYDHRRVARGQVTMATSQLINFLLTGVSLRPAHGDVTSLTRYNANLDVPVEAREVADLLKSMIRCYVIDRPGLATQQKGQRRILNDLVTWFAEDPGRLLPPARLEEYREHKDPFRAAADSVASMTEAQTVQFHRRMSGQDYGQVTELR